MLDALGIGLGGFGRDAERAQEIDHQPVTHAHAIGEGVAFLGQKNPAIGARGRQAGPFQARNGFDGGGM